MISSRRFRELRKCPGVFQNRTISRPGNSAFKGVTGQFPKLTGCSAHGLDLLISLRRTIGQ